MITKPTRSIKKSILTFMLISTTATVFAQSNNLKLWYDKPSGKVWEKAMPIGNGRLAGMVYGNSERETIQLNEATLWSGGPSRNDEDQALSVLKDVHRLIFENKRKEAADLASKKMMTSKDNGMCYQPVGNLYLNFPGHEQYQNYHRELDLSKAITTTTYTVDGVTYTREAFASNADQVIVVHLSASKP